MNKKTKIVALSALLVALAATAWASVNVYAERGNHEVWYSSTFHFYNSTTEQQDSNSWGDESAYVPEGSYFNLYDDVIDIWMNTSTGPQQFREGYEYTMTGSTEM